MAGMITRTWRGWVATERTREYVDYVRRTGLRSYRDTPGNLGAEIWTRDAGEGRTEFTTVSWWTGWAAIKAFAGEDPSVAVFYPQDDEWLLDRETTVRHFEVSRDGSDTTA
jgi:heme-degrading monooxygenase HmoA